MTRELTRRQLAALEPAQPLAGGRLGHQRRRYSGGVSEPDRRARGIAAYASQFGVPGNEAEETLAGMVGPRMAEEAIQAAGAAWSADSPLSLRERSLVVVAALASQGGADARLRSHLRWAIEHGVSAEELEAALTLLAVYTGFPRASVAMELLREELSSPARDRSSRSHS